MLNPILEKKPYPQSAVCPVCSSRMSNDLGDTLYYFEDDRTAYFKCSGCGYVASVYPVTDELRSELEVCYDQSDS